MTETDAVTTSLGAGNAVYMAPELLVDFDNLGDDFRPRYSTKSDIYAFSMVAYEVYQCISHSHSCADSVCLDIYWPKPISEGQKATRPDPSYLPHWAWGKTRAGRQYSGAGRAALEKLLGNVTE
jgi:serine/threonine protein kinase